MRSFSFRLKKEYVVFGGLALVDAIDAFGTVYGGLYRLLAFIHGWAYQRTSAVSCALQPYILVWLWTASASATTLLVVSCDRLLAVRRPFVYYQFTQRYAIKLILSGYLASTTVYALSWTSPAFWTTESGTNQTSRLCLISLSLPEYVAGTQVMAAIFSLASVLVYLIALCGFLRFGSQQTLTSHLDRRSLEKFVSFQKKMTLTFGISTLCTAVFDTSPRLASLGFHLYTMALKLDQQGGETMNLAFLLFSIGYSSQKVNATVNFCLLYVRHAEFRSALHDLLRFRICRSKITVVVPVNNCVVPSGEGPKI